MIIINFLMNISTYSYLVESHSHHDSAAPMSLCKRHRAIKEKEDQEY